MWFAENAWPPMLIAGLAALVCLGLWNTDRRNLYLIMTLFCLGAIGGFYAFERATVTEGERLQGIVIRMCDEFRKRDPATLSHFSDTVPEWKEVCKTAMETVEIGNDLHLTDFHTKFLNQESQADVHFRANATISAMGFSGHHPFRCIVTFQKEAGAWKIVDVQRLDPIKGNKLDVMARQ